jgi:U3 small nucleolar RNA-associated protein 14
MKNAKVEPGKLAGWGSWAGPDIKKKEIDVEELKRKRLEKFVFSDYFQPYQIIERRKAEKKRWKYEERDNK